MLFPKKVKHRKWQTARRNPARVTADTRGITLAFGAYGIKATTDARVNSKQIESARRAITRTIGKTGRLWIRIFPDRPYTAKPAEVGMGKGKGDLQGYVFPVLPGRMLFEIDGVSTSVAREALRKAAAKLPVKTRFVERRSV